MTDIVDQLHNLLLSQRPGTANSDINALMLKIEIPRLFIDQAITEIERLRAALDKLRAQREDEMLEQKATEARQEWVDENDRHR